MYVADQYTIYTAMEDTGLDCVVSTQKFDEGPMYCNKNSFTVEVCGSSERFWCSTFEDAAQYFEITVC